MSILYKLNAAPDLHAMIDRDYQATPLLHWNKVLPNGYCLDIPAPAPCFHLMNYSALFHAFLPAISPA